MLELGGDRVDVAQNPLLADEFAESLEFLGETGTSD